jgi:hypothetical protein
MRARKDPIAVALAARYPGVRMPRLGVAENDAADLVAYLEAQASLLNAQGASETHDHGSHRH